MLQRAPVGANYLELMWDLSLGTALEFRGVIYLLGKCKKNDATGELLKVRTSCREVSLKIEYPTRSYHLIGSCQKKKNHNFDPTLTGSLCKLSSNF